MALSPSPAKKDAEFSLCPFIGLCAIAVKSEEAQQSLQTNEVFNAVPANNAAGAIRAAGGRRGQGPG